MNSPKILQYKIIGNYRHYNLCRFCFSNKLTSVINLGYMPLAGGFLKSINVLERYYPLEISFCKNCYLLQSVNVIDKDVLFKDYFYFSSVSKTLTDHFKDLAGELTIRLKTKQKPFVVEVGCNDGTLIKALTSKNIRVVGVDPADNIVQPLIKKKLPIINNYFSEKVAQQIVKNYGKADVLCGFNVFAHIEDMHDVMRGIKTLLKNDGIFVFEVHYLGNLLREIQYDMIYHEHQYYYSLLTLQKFFTRYDMEIFDAQPTPIHAGSMRYYVQMKNQGKNQINSRVSALMIQEKEQLFDKVTPYVKFSKKVAQSKKELLELLSELKRKRKKIVGYGASGRGTIIMNYCGLDETFLDYVIDDSPFKQHAFTPGTHLEIKNASVLQATDRPDFILLFAWSFFNEIKKRNKDYLNLGGKFLVPLPKLKIITDNE
jgi:methylation protein EvaC